MPLILVGIVLPLLCATAGALLLRGYPITERRHAAIRRRIARAHPHLATSVG
jgi:Na+/melibiose symporter-like transporter